MLSSRQNWVPSTSRASNIAFNPPAMKRSKTIRGSKPRMTRSPIKPWMPAKGSDEAEGTIGSLHAPEGAVIWRIETPTPKRAYPKIRSLLPLSRNSPIPRIRGAQRCSTVRGSHSTVLNPTRRRGEDRRSRSHEAPHLNGAALKDRVSCMQDTGPPVLRFSYSHLPDAHFRLPRCGSCAT